MSVGKLLLRTLASEPHKAHILIVFTILVKFMCFHFHVQRTDIVDCVSYLSPVS